MTPLEPAPDSIARGRPVGSSGRTSTSSARSSGAAPCPRSRSTARGGARAVVTASTGNHGAATAWAARELGLEAVVYVPEGASRTKVERMRGLGADLREEGADFDAAKELALAYASANGLPFFEDGAEPAQYAGYEAIGDELLDQLGGAPEPWSSRSGTVRSWAGSAARSSAARRRRSASASSPPPRR